MIAYCSPSTGICSISDKNDCVVVDTVSNAVLLDRFKRITIGNIHDWTPIEEPDQNSLLKRARMCYFCERAISNVEALYLGVATELRKELLLEIEDSLKTELLPALLVSQLLKVPFIDSSRLKIIVEACLQNGIGATANILETVFTLQPLLKQLVSLWLRISDNIFASFDNDRSKVWQIAVCDSVVYETLTSNSRTDITNAWSRLVFKATNSLNQRKSITLLAKIISEHMLPESGGISTEVSQSIDNDAWTVEKPFYQSGNPADILQKVLLQINAILSEISLGNDDKARHFIGELIEYQLSTGATEHLCKTLCNIAKQSARLFRTDIEYECLSKAIELMPSDVWTIAQMADHFKRVARYDDAIFMLNSAINNSNDYMLKTILADVYAQKRDYGEALAIYRAIELRPEADTELAIADVKRKMGELTEAMEIYDKLAFSGHSNSRLQAGRAEVYKRRLQYDKAKEIYMVLINDTSNQDENVVYRHALINILVRIQDYPAAYDLCDRLVTEYPFDRFARVQRAIIQALLGNPQKALSDLPDKVKARAVNEWINSYVKGLLLLLLHRFKEAKTALASNTEKALLDQDAEGILQLGAAVCFLRNVNDVSKADEILSRLPSLSDQFANAVKAVFEYHIAFTMRRKDEIAGLKKKINEYGDPQLCEIANNIDKKQWDFVWRLEVNALLRLAA